tara:strand:- start:2235 stop:3464 length:1230 start_codon:yes stop_codon:yes gene_type:complete
MRYFITPTQDTWISNGSSKITGESFKDQNFGRDQILELKKEFFNNSFDHQTRVLVNFEGTDFTDLREKVQSGAITNPKYFLRLYEAEGNAELSTTYDLVANPLYQAWSEGTGKFGDRPKNTNGCSWENTFNPIGGNEITWSFNPDASPQFIEFDSTFEEAESFFNSVSSSDFLSGSSKNGGVWIIDKGFEASQSFNLQTPDIEMNVTDIVNKWVDKDIENYGFILRFSGSQETDSETFGQLKFFSRNTHTIYQPRLEVVWDDSSFSDKDTKGNIGNNSPLVVTGLQDNFLYMKGLKEEYKEGERVKFRIGARKRYIQKSFTTSVQTVSGSFIPQDKGFYAIKDVATDEFIIPFDDNFTKISCDDNGSYFIQWLDGFYPDRVYKILLKLKYNDGQEQIFDDDFEFIVKRG